MKRGPNVISRSGKLVYFFMFKRLQFTLIMAYYYMVIYAPEKTSKQEGQFWHISIFN